MKKLKSTVSRYNCFEIILTSSRFKFQSNPLVFTKNSFKNSNKIQREFINQLNKCKFISQQDLETLIQNAQVKAKTGLTSFLNYNGYLKTNLMNFSDQKIQMQWILLVKTEKQTTSKLIHQYFLGKLNETKEIIIKIEVRHLVHKKLDPSKTLLNNSSILLENPILIENLTPWTPGIFTKESVAFKKQLQETSILARIFEQPKIYNFYFFNNMKMPRFLSNKFKKYESSYYLLVGFGIIVFIYVFYPRFFRIIHIFIRSFYSFNLTGINSLSYFNCSKNSETLMNLEPQMQANRTIRCVETSFLAINFIASCLDQRNFPMSNGILDNRDIESFANINKNDRLIKTL